MHHPSLSWEANGVLCWAQTQPTFTLKNLLRKGTGRDRAYRILRELLALGYLERFECRDESGKFLEYGYRMALNPKKSVAENPEAVMPREATPFTVNPDAAPEDSSRGTENVSHTEIEPLRENPQTDNQPLLFKRLKEEILNDLLSVFNKQLKEQLKEEILTELLTQVATYVTHEEQ
jgi:hypothetical protein